MARTSRPRRLTTSCARCGNEDDLEACNGKAYCQPCRTCPHEHCYIDAWDPGCPLCVRALYTLLTFEGPRIHSFPTYVRECLRWGIRFSEILVWSFEEEDALEEWTGPKLEPFHRWNRDGAPHFQLLSREVREQVRPAI